MKLQANQPQKLRDKIRDSWDKYSLWPLVSLGFIFIFAYAVPIIWPDANPDLLSACDTTLTVIWVVFISDYVGRLLLSRDRLEFVKSNVIDLLAILLPALRPLRALRIVSILTIATRRLGNSVRHRVSLYVTTLAIFTWFMAGLAMTDAERDVDGANITNAVDGWFWSFTGLVAGGNGPLYPVSDQGKMFEVVVFLAAFALVGTLSAIIVSWFIDASSAGGKKTKTEVELLRDDVARLSKQIQVLIDQNEGQAAGSKKR